MTAQPSEAATWFRAHIGEENWQRLHERPARVNRHISQRGIRSAGQGLNPFWGWSALGYLMPLQLACGYDPTDLESAQVRALGRDELGVVFPE